MFKLTSDRIDYSSILSAPFGYKLDFSVGTTYSLDLDALIGASIALGLSEDIDSYIKDNPIYMFEALSKTADKIAVFCHGGQIKAPFKSNTLYILLEKMVAEINMQNNKSFHPKTWLIKYTNDKDSIYRFIVLSRNLTFDNSWDIAVCLEGRIQDKTIKDKNKPIRDYLLSLINLGNDSLNIVKKEKIKSLADEIMQVNFEVDNKLFKDFSFHPIGVEGYSIKSIEALNKNFDEIFVISPFLSETIVKQLNDLAKSKNNVLITRKSELSKLKNNSVSNFEIYALKDIVIDGESAAEDLDNKIQDIHSKIYLIEKGNKSELILGSLNASHSAFYENAEFVLRLISSKKNIDIAKVKKEIFGDSEKENPFERVELVEVKEDDFPCNNLERVIKEICRLKVKGKVKTIKDKFSVEIEFEKDFSFDNITVIISPLFKNIEKSISRNIVFDNLDLLELSEFYIIKALDGEGEIRRVIKIPLEDLPENRERAVANYIIRDRNLFVQYVNFLLGEDYLLSAVENENTSNRGFSHNSSVALSGLYEKMLKAAVYSKEKFEDIKRLVGLIMDKNVIPEEFYEIFSLFEKVINK